MFFSFGNFYLEWDTLHLGLRWNEWSTVGSRIRAERRPSSAILKVWTLEEADAREISKWSAKSVTQHGVLCVSFSVLKIKSSFTFYVTGGPRAFGVTSCLVPPLLLGQNHPSRPGSAALLQSRAWTCYREPSPSPWQVKENCQNVRMSYSY